MVDSPQDVISAIPPDTGAEGTQREARDGELLGPEPPQGGSAVVATAVRDASLTGRGFATESTRHLIPGIVDGLNADLASCRMRCAQLDEKLEKAVGEQNKEHTRAEVLHSRLSAARKIKVLAGGCTTVGGLLFGIGSTPGDRAFLMYLVGAVFIILGWVVTLWPEEK